MSLCLQLRWHCHAHLKVSERNPFKTGVREVSPWLRLPPLRVFGTTVKKERKRNIPQKSYLFFYI